MFFKNIKISDKVYKENSDEEIITSLEIFEEQLKKYFPTTEDIKMKIVDLKSTYSDEYIFHMTFCKDYKENIFISLDLELEVEVVTIQEYFNDKILKIVKSITDFEFISVATHLEEVVKESGDFLKKLKKNNKEIKIRSVETEFLKKLNKLFFCIKELKKLDL